MRFLSIIALVAWAPGLTTAHGGSLATEIAQRRHYLEAKGQKVIHGRSVCEDRAAGDRENYLRLARDLHEEYDLTST
jgi:hypothetical protein